MQVTEQGVVERTEGRSAWIRVERSSACASCPSRDECNVESGGGMVVKAENTAGCSTGDRVRLSMPARSFLKSTFLVYILPVAALVVGAFFGRKFINIERISEDTASVVCAFGFMALYFLLLRHADRKFARDSNSSPRITAVIKKSAD